MKNNIFFLLSICCLVEPQCQKDENGGYTIKEPVLFEELAKLPPLSQNGSNTFGCLLNGWAWPAHDTDLFIVFAQEKYVNNKKVLKISATTYYDNSNFHKDHIHFETDDIITLPGEYRISFEAHGNDFVSIYYHGVDYNTINTPSNRNTVLYLNIHNYDTINHIISGTFRITLRDLSGNYKLKLENGRFDSRY